MKHFIIFATLLLALLASCTEPSPRIPTLEVVCNGRFDKAENFDREFVNIIQINGNNVDGIEGRWEADAITWNSLDGKTKMVFYETTISYFFEGVEEVWFIDHRPVLKYSYKSRPGYLE